MPSAVKMGYARLRQDRLFWHQINIDHPEQLPKINATALIHLAPLWLLPPLLPVLRSLQAKRVIAFGSTSLFSKADSADASERQLVARLSAAEEIDSPRLRRFGNELDGIPSNTGL